MPISFPATCNRGDRGFTLVELMVVVAILALASTAVILTIPDGSANLREEAQRFAGRVGAARDQAILMSRPMAVSVDAAGYGFARRERGAWRALEDKPFATTPWRAEVHPAATARIVFDGTGATEDAAQVVLVRRDRQVPVTVSADGRVAVGG